ncbi:MAG: molybdopterin-binding protein [Bacillota bacterium]|nr:molybdopterin-binding protein [Bacillota bacterium]
MGIVKAVCISERRGVGKKPVSEGRFIKNYGIENDAHAGDWHRQVSLLSSDKISEFNARGANAEVGDFGENLIVEGFDFSAMPVGTRLLCGGVVLEITQIGKECHNHCAIYRRMGDCIMPKQGVFARVLEGGTIRPGDEMTAFAPPPDRPLTAAVVTLSDKGARGEREDKSGPLIKEYLEKAGYAVIETIILPDEQNEIEKQLKRLSDSRQADLILTTGGTGFSERDRTPEATLNVATRNAPGIAEAIRYGSMQITKRAMLSRGASVIRNRTLIVNLPGSPKAVKESLDIIMDELPHGINILTGRDKECGRA